MDNYRDLIKRQMKSKNISYEKLGKVLGTSRQNVWFMLNKTETINLNSLQKICEFLGIEITIGLK